MKSYTFEIVYMYQQCYATYVETKSFQNEKIAYQHFRKLLEKFKVNGQSYYLCSWATTETFEINKPWLLEREEFKKKPNAGELIYY